MASLGDHLWYAAIGAAIVLIIEFWIAEWREEKALQLRQQVRERQEREQRERHRRHTRWMQ